MADKMRGQALNLAAIELHDAGVGGVQAGNQVEQGRFAGRRSGRSGVDSPASMVRRRGDRANSAELFRDVSRPAAPFPSISRQQEAGQGQALGRSCACSSAAASSGSGRQRRVTSPKYRPVRRASTARRRRRSCRNRAASSNSRAKTIRGSRTKNSAPSAGPNMLCMPRDHDHRQQFAGKRPPRPLPLTQDRSEGRAARRPVPSPRPKITNTPSLSVLRPANLETWRAIGSRGSPQHMAERRAHDAQQQHRARRPNQRTAA